jgi:NAD(P)-dependent dehydrogenase (short-subunit alcohol dehydrogenase family)
MRFAGKAVLVTGAARGFGRLAALDFAREGARLVISDQDADGLEATAAELAVLGAEVEAHPGDVAQEATAEALVAASLARFGALDVALNNAGIGQDFMKLRDTPTALMERILAVDLMAVFLALKHQIPAMERQGGGAILNVSSAAGLVGAPMLAAYAAAKHGVVGLTRSAAGECARKGVRINAICPAFAATAMVEDFLDQMHGGRDAAVGRIVANMPMRRLGTPAEVVQAMLWLCAPENSFMTGHALAVDGGLTAV